MKKIFSLVLVAALALTTAVAFAEHYKVQEDFATFDVELDIPEGATYQQNIQPGWICLEMQFDGDAGLFFDMNIAPSEELGDVSLGDVPEDDLAAFTALVSEDFSAPQSESFVTPSGNTILLTKETDAAAGAFVSMDTIYRGFIFNLTMNHKDFSEMTDADMDMMHKLIESVQINPV